MTQRRVTSVVLFFVTLVLLGCQQEKARMTDYLKSLESSNERMNALYSELLESIRPIISQVGKDTLDLSGAQGQVEGSLTRLEAELKTLKGLHPPQQAEALQAAVVKQQEASLELVRQSLPMLGVAAEKSQLLRQIKAKPAKGQEYMPKVKELQKRQDAIKSKSDELARQAAHFEKQVREEQQRLQEEFGIVIKMESPTESR